MNSTRDERFLAGAFAEGGMPSGAGILPHQRKQLADSRFLLAALGEGGGPVSAGTKWREFPTSFSDGLSSPFTRSSTPVQALHAMDHLGVWAWRKKRSNRGGPDRLAEDAASLCNNVELSIRLRLAALDSLAYLLASQSKANWTGPEATDLKDAVLAWRRVTRPLGEPRFNPERIKLWVHLLRDLNPTAYNILMWSSELLEIVKPPEQPVQDHSEKK